MGQGLSQVSRRKSISVSREELLTQSVNLSQERINELKRELESVNDAHAIVLETKESVLRQLTRQNSQLCNEREVLLGKLERMTASTEQLTKLLRNLQQKSIVTVQQSSGNTIHGGGRTPK